MAWGPAVGDGKEGEEQAGRSAWPDVLSAAGKQLIPVLLTGASLIGFVAFAGGVIVWTRFSAAKVPPDQAVNAVPRDELVAIGSALLLLFGFFGIMALVGVFLVDRGGRATPGMARALLAFFLVEGATTIVLADGVSLEQTIAVVGLLALPVAAAFWATWVDAFVSLEDDLPTRDGERPGQRGYGMFLLPADRGTFLEAHGPIVTIVVGVLGGIAIDALRGAGAILLAWLVLIFVAFLALALWRSHQLGWELRRELDCAREARLGRKLREAEEAEGWAADNQRVEEARLLNERPMRLELRLNGVVLMVIALIVAVALPYLMLDKAWVGVSIGAAAALTSALWRIAMLAVSRVIWFGVAVFLSVPLFGTLTAMARNVSDPQVQPMALIRTTDGPDEAIQGLYVTEADDRVYFATVATEGCSNDLTAHSGRLEWVPKSEVVAMSVGPLQDIEDAAGSALEMAYALTPAVETPAGGESSLTAGELEAAEAERKPVSSATDKRLEDAGPAVRPNYGAGISLTPENASPGDRVTLRMSAPNDDDAVNGFGRTRNGHTVRVGGVRAHVLKEFAHRADTAEFLETEEGQLLRLEKDEPYEEGQKGYKRVGELHPGEDDDLFLKLVDPRVLAVGKHKMGEDDGEGDQDGIYLALSTDGAGSPLLADASQTVTLRGAVDDQGNVGTSIKTRLMPRPKAQAWHERQIRFVVPENVSTGAVTVECSQLAGQPLLRVAHAPEARVTVHMQADSSRVRFDSSHSSDADHEPISRRWSIAGLRHGNRAKLTVDLPPRPRPYTVRLTTSDQSGRTGTTELHLLRLPVSLFRSDDATIHNRAVLREARATMETEALNHVPDAVEIDGHADDPGGERYNVRLSLRRAEHVREFLLKKPEVDIEGQATVPVQTLAYGEDCPTQPGLGHSRDNRRVDVIVLEAGVSVAPPHGCHPHHLQSTEWKLP